MIKYYITLSLRNIWRNKAFSAINVIGISVGLIAFFLIIQYVTFEFGYDRFHNGHEQIFRVVHRQLKNGEVTDSSATSYIGVRKLVYDNFPGVRATGFSPLPIDLGFTYAYKGKTFWDHGARIQADSAFFSVFPDLLVSGDARTALLRGSNLVLSEKLSAMTFQNEDPINKVLDDIAEIDENAGHTFEVKGVFKNLPANSHMHFDAIVGIDTNLDTLTHHWTSPGLHTYIRVPAYTDVPQMEARLNTMLGEIAKDHPNMAGAQILLQPIAEIHLHPGFGDELEPHSDISLPLILSIIAICILVIAWINYINLETARFVTQAKEIGIRRVIGSSKNELAAQHIIRYLLLNLIAFAVAAVGIRLIVPYFSYLTGIPIDALSFSMPAIWIAALAFYVMGSILVGVLPALLLFRLNPASIIKGSVLPGSNTRTLRSSLIVVQYVTSLLLIVFVIVVREQLHFIKSANRSVDTEHVVAIENALAYSQGFEGNWDTYPALSSALLSHPAIKEISVSSNVPGRPINFTLVNEIKRNKLDPYNPTRFKLLFIDHNYASVYGLKLKAGRTFRQATNGNYDENGGRIVLNEAAINALGFKSPEEALNQKVYFPLFPFMKPESEIIGIIEDHYHESVKTLVPPTIYFGNDAAHQQVYYSIRLNKGADLEETLSFIEREYKRVFPRNPFAYFFVDELYEKQFQAEVHFFRVFGMFSGVALFLACLGILGITLFEANTRLREISIRKILGGSVVHIITILSQKQVWAILLSLLIAFPIAFYACSQWLLRYPVRVDLSVLPFVTAVVVITLLTFGASLFHTVKAALTNPVDHLRNE